MKTAERKQIPWGLFVVAFIFLFNPNIAIIDPLPDFLGYIIISVALSKLAMLNDAMYEAKRAFDRMILVDIGKVIAIFWVFGMTFGEEQNTSLLLWSFVFGVLEILFAIPAYTKLFDGFSTLGDFYKNTSIHGAKNESKKSYTQKIKSLSAFFVVFKAALTCLPELSVLGTVIYDETSNFSGLYQYIGVMRMFCFIPVLIVGIVWLVRAIKYFLRIKADSEFVNEIDNEYNNKKITRSGLFVIRDVKIATLFFTLGSVFSLDFYFENVNFLPDILTVVAFALALFYFSKVASIKKPFVITMLASYAILTVAKDCLRFYFFHEYYFNAINKDAGAFYTYIAMVVAVAIEGVLLVLLYFAFAKAIKPVIKEHTGYVLGKEIMTETETKQIAILQKSLLKTFTVLVDFSAVCVLADLFYSLYGAFYAFLNKNFGWTSIISIACGLLLVGMTIRAVSRLREAVQTKYMLQ